MDAAKKLAWTLDQRRKSLFFRDKLREWHLIEVAQLIETVRGDRLDWDLDNLRISEEAWRLLIHSGIKPIIVFANPAILRSIAKSVGYYRMLAMVSQKSMSQVGVATARYEQSSNLPSAEAALSISRHLNHIISRLVESDSSVNRREFDIWRGMAAGTQAQGSWQNKKGDLAEFDMRRDLVKVLRTSDMVADASGIDIWSRSCEINLRDGRRISLASEPDIVLRVGERIHAAVEIKGGIDQAGILERVGAAMKSLSRVKEEDPTAITILVIPGVSMTPQARNDIESNKQTVNAWFSLEDILDGNRPRIQFYRLLGLTP